jgi:hypothetical protein
MTASVGVQDRNMSALVPLLKVLSQIDLRNVSLGVRLLDLTRQKVTFHQENVRTLDWKGMRDAFAGTEPGKIDVKALGERRHSAQFFASEVEKRLAGNRGAARVLIVLSSWVEFESGVDLTPLPPRETGTRVYYIRYHSPPIRMLHTDPAALGNPRYRIPPRYPSSESTALHRTPQVDQLEPLLQPIGPKLFDVTTPEEVRKALALMIDEISRM